MASYILVCMCALRKRLIGIARDNKREVWPPLVPSWLLLLLRSLRVASRIPLEAPPPRSSPSLASGLSFLVENYGDKGHKGQERGSAQKEVKTPPKSGMRESSIQKEEVQHRPKEEEHRTTKKDGTLVPSNGRERRKQHHRIGQKGGESTNQRRGWRNTAPPRRGTESINRQKKGRCGFPLLCLWCVVVASSPIGWVSIHLWCCLPLLLEGVLALIVIMFSRIEPPKKDTSSNSRT